MFADGDTGAVAERLSAAQLVAIYEQAEADIRRGFALVAGATEALNGAVQGRYAITLHGRHRIVDVDFRDPTDTITHLRRGVWHVLVERTQVRKIMSMAAWKELEKQLDEEDPPAITIANLEGLIAKFKADGPAMLEAAVHEVFDRLRPPHSRYKTNTEFEIGERVCLAGWLEPAYGSHDWHLNYHYQQEAIALENVFRMLDGKVRSDMDAYHGELATAIGACKAACVGETEYFAFKGYKNRSLHLKFKRLDLVKRLNAIAGGMRLKPSVAA